jgi:hypothetical protein
MCNIAISDLGLRPLTLKKAGCQFSRWHWFAPALEKLRILNAANCPPSDNCAWSGLFKFIWFGSGGQAWQSCACAATATIKRLPE